MRISIILLSIFIFCGVSSAQNENAKNIKVMTIYILENGTKKMQRQAQYDESGKVSNEKNYYNGKVTQESKYFYEPDGRLSYREVTWTMGADEPPMKYKVTYEYDNDERISAFRLEGQYSTDVSPNYFQYVYDENGRQIKMLHYFRYPDIGEYSNKLAYTTEYEYDAKGNKIQAIQKCNMDFPDDMTMHYTYDENNYVISSEVIYSDLTSHIFQYEYELYK